MDNYQILVNILDKIRLEAPKNYKSYHPDNDSIEALNQARAKAFIHLLLKVYFGLLDFESREEFVTDETNDGGIDGYYIDSDSKTVYFIQSKFRTSKKNFENKPISLEEILSMDINRILDGESTYENGVKYSPKILRMQKKITMSENISRYKYQVIILANVRGVSSTQLRVLTGGIPTEIIDFEKCYNKLVFPLVSGTYYNASDVNISINLTDKNAGANISYSVMTKFSKCEITVLFVPTIEIAKIMNKYRNSILKYNPRSYLELDGQSVNNAIRTTLINESTNEFALFNNGITFLSDETYFNQKIGQKDTAQLSLKNPQIINGGQTAYTLNLIYSEYNDREKIFRDKEVLVKIITFQDKIEEKLRLRLIDEISLATNRQTAVTNSDRKSNLDNIVNLQTKLFQRYGLFFERKRGEFGDGVREQYISSENILDRSFFTRIYFACNGQFRYAQQKKAFQKFDFSSPLTNDTLLDQCYFAYICYHELINKIYDKPLRRTKLFQQNIAAMIFTLSKYFRPEKIEDYISLRAPSIDRLLVEWTKYEAFAQSKRDNAIFFKKVRSRKNQDTQQEDSYVFNSKSYYNSKKALKDIEDFFSGRDI